MPVADDQSTEPTECEEDRDAERSGHEESAVHRGVAELLTELLHDDADARLLSLTEELLTDDGADDRQTCRDAEAGEDRRHRSGELEFEEACGAAHLAQGEQIVLRRVDGGETEQGVREDGEDRDHHAHDQSHASVPS